MPKKSKSILQLYQIYSQTAENTTDRRLKTNGLYITLNTWLIALISIFAKCDDVTNMEKKLPIACYTKELDILEQGNNCFFYWLKAFGPKYK